MRHQYTVTKPDGSKKETFSSKKKAIECMVRYTETAQAFGDMRLPSYKRSPA